jgi:hypothetical protein
MPGFVTLLHLCFLQSHLIGRYHKIVLHQDWPHCFNMGNANIYKQITKIMRTKKYTKARLLLSVKAATILYIKKRITKIMTIRMIIWI